MGVAATSEMRMLPREPTSRRPSTTRPTSLDRRRANDPRPEHCECRARTHRSRSPASAKLEPVGEVSARAEALRDRGTPKNAARGLPLPSPRPLKRTHGPWWPEVPRSVQ
jgi:hypothetical protein